jgi:subtilisin family serine protease
MSIKNAAPALAASVSFGVLGLAATSMAIALLLAPKHANAEPAARSSEGAWVKGRLLVMPNPGLSEAELRKIVRAHGAKVRKITSQGLYAVDLPPEASEKAVAALLSNNPHIKFVEVDGYGSNDLVSNDPFMGSQWHLPKIGAPAAWDSSQGNGVTIAILDSGVDPTHPDLKGRLVAGYNFVDGNTNTADVFGHGTKVAGAAAASMNNAAGVASVAGLAKIMPIRVAYADGNVAWSNMAKGLTYAADRGVMIANMSFSGAAGSASVLSAAKYFKDKGGLVFVSAGNSNKDLGYAATDTMVILAATTQSDTKASFSNFGDHVQLSAPGSGIYTTVNGGTYAAVSGTSFAAPITAGVAALVMAANPALTNAQVQTVLFNTAADLGTAGRDNYFGYGRVDAAAAVKLALAMKGTSTTPGDTQAPTASIISPAPSSTVSGVVAVKMSASDNVAATKAELLVNGKVIATDTSAPFAFSWDSKTVPNGMANLSVLAYDAAGNAGQSAAVAVNIANSAAADTIPPTTKISAPLDGATVSGAFWVVATGADNAGVEDLTMSLFINGVKVASSVDVSQLKYAWNTRAIATGSYTLKVETTDAAGNVASKSIRVTR